MTAGHPDWQTYASWRGAPLVELAGGALPVAGLIFGPFAIPHFSGVTLTVRGGTRQAQVLVSFYPDAGGVVLLAQLAFTIPAGCILQVNIPALGQYVQLQVINGTLSAGVITLALIPTNVAAAREEYFSNAGGAPLAWQSASVPAAGSLTITTTEIFAGPVIVFAGTSSGTAFHWTMNYFDDTNSVFQLIAGESGSNFGQREEQPCAAPPSQLQLGISNDDTVARTITGAILRAG